ncbi:MAG: hypothetical protein JXB30_17185 [Anaerolineae bacterium]|nr:hypothetical protein [Anaerolineae bacterium]
MFGMHIAAPESGPKCVIVAGCPRSGTSMTMQLLAKAGLDIGEHLVPSSVSNRRGHFEDQHIVALHDQILKECLSSWQYTGEVELAVTAVHQQRMRQIVEDYSARGTNWGFKDPRVSLLLDDWREIIGNMRVLMIYRHYSHCSRSLYRRHSRALCYWKSPTDYQHLVFFHDPSLPMRMWLAYNKALLDYYYLHRSECLVVSQEAILQGWDVVAAVNTAFALELNRNGIRSVEPALADNTAPEFDVSRVAPELQAQLDAIWNELSRVSSAPTTPPHCGANIPMPSNLRKQLVSNVHALCNIELPAVGDQTSAGIKDKSSQDEFQKQTSTVQTGANVSRKNGGNGWTSVADFAPYPVDSEQAEMQFCHQTALNYRNEVALIRLGNALVLRGRASDISDLLDLASKYSSDDPWYHYHAYRWFWQAGAVDAAIAECRRSLEMDPGLWQARLALYYSYWELGIDSEDINSLERAIVYDSTANMLLRLSQLNASLERHNREEFYYYAGGAIECRKTDSLEHYRQLLEQVNNEVGRHLLLYYFVEHMRALKVWWAAAVKSHIRSL